MPFCWSEPAVDFHMARIPFSRENPYRPHGYGKLSNRPRLLGGPSRRHREAAMRWDAEAAAENKHELQKQRARQDEEYRQRTEREAYEARRRQERERVESETRLERETIERHRMEEQRRINEERARIEAAHRAAQKAAAEQQLLLAAHARLQEYQQREMAASHQQRSPEGCSSIESIRALRDMARNKRELDIRIWDRRNAQEGEQAAVKAMCKQSDHMWRQMLNIVVTWVKSDFTDIEWPIAETIQSGIAGRANGPPIWQRQYPWTMRITEDMTQYGWDED